MRNLFLLHLILLSSIAFSQVSKVTGKVYNSTNNEALPFVKISVIGQQFGAVSDADGNYLIEGLPAGVYSFKASSSGYQDLIINDITVTISRVVDLDFGMEPFVKEQKEIVVKASPFVPRSESPVSLRTLNATEIERQPGAGRDVSKVLQALPGVASRATFRNDIVIRERKFHPRGRLLLRGFSLQSCKWIELCYFIQAKGWKLGWLDYKFRTRIK
ncbi:MAG: carboxypeptidase-like regulatory domain-containing protein [Cryomorphaceae bacterium]|nr:carboxypeptidase-like regulatory domain-containing protein [Cryomorphaceae bacterium]